MKQFKNNFSKYTCLFDVFIFEKNQDNTLPIELKDDDKLFEITKKNKVSLIKRKTPYEIVLYESIPDKTNNNLLFIYPFKADIPIEKEQYENLMLSFSYKNIMSVVYPIRIQVTKNQFINKSFWTDLRENLLYMDSHTIPSLNHVYLNSGLLFEDENMSDNNQRNNKNIKKILKPIPPNKSISNDIQNKKYYLYLCEVSNKKIMLTYFNQTITENEILKIKQKVEKIELVKLIELFSKPNCFINCKTCGSETIMKTTISKLPTILCLQFKRFTYDFKKKEFKKIETFVDFPDNLNVYSLLDKEQNCSFEINTSKIDSEYELFAVNEHLGKVSSGHYIAHAKVRNQWYCFNDKIVTQDNDYKNKNALVLFYKRKNVSK